MQREILKYLHDIKESIDSYMTTLEIKGILTNTKRTSYFAVVLKESLR